MALALLLVGGFAFLMMAPVRFVQSGWGEFIGTPVRPSVWIFGGVLIFACVAACVEAFRHGSRGDKIACCIAALLTLSLAEQFFSFMILPVRPAPF